MAEQKLNFNRVDMEKDLFRTSIRYTGQRLGFSETLIEKDYYCSLILTYLYSGEDRGLIFRGGTALNKIYAGFY